jgi:hypothetical protein
LVANAYALHPAHSAEREANRFFNTVTGNKLESMTTPEMIVHLKGMGLKPPEREKVIATLRDAGQAAALEQASELVARSAAQLAGAKAAAKQLFGISI